MLPPPCYFLLPYPSPNLSTIIGIIDFLIENLSRRYIKGMFGNVARPWIPSCFSIPRWKTVFGCTKGKGEVDQPAFISVKIPSRKGFPRFRVPTRVRESLSRSQTCPKFLKNKKNKKQPPFGLKSMGKLNQWS